MYGHVLHYTGCRPTEALQLTVWRVLVSKQAPLLVLRSLKKRRINRRGRERAPQYRTVPVLAALIESLGLVFNLRAYQRPVSGGNGNWRVTFRFIGVDVELVNYFNYH